MTATLESSLVKCSKCQALLFPELYNIGALTPCPSCQSPLDIEIFPAILLAPTAVLPESILVEGESGCFYHPSKTATIVCQGCGRFLCALCDLELNGRHVCPVCLESGQKKAKFKDLENTRVLWDRLAISVAVLPLLLVWTSIIGAPIALYLIIRYRKAPCSITGKSNLDFIVAAVLAVLQIAAWALVIILVPWHKHR
jgi:hypothetical protein